MSATERLDGFVAKFGTRGFRRIVSVEFVISFTGKIILIVKNWRPFYIFNERYMSFKRLVVFENESHQPKAVKHCKLLIFLYTCSYTKWQPIKEF